MGICTFVTMESAGEALAGGVQADGWELFLQEDTSQYAALPDCRDPPPEEALTSYSPRARSWGSRGPRSSPYGQAPGTAGSVVDNVNLRKSVFFANASYETAETAILEHFEEIGRIRSCTIFRNPDGSSRGMGVVEYFNAAAATRAYYNLHGLLLEGRPVVVDEYRP
uniref:RRM domain-containing protein n=1 Tax=Alexandrium catenella TaxID=2925 RepID=A0A7S1RGY4_ALECA